jgi:hypothetical protein
MTDLTLNEYKGISDEKLSKTLKEEARIICGIDSPDFRKTVNDFHPPFHHSKHKKAVIHRRSPDA